MRIGKGESGFFFPPPTPSLPILFSEPGSEKSTPQPCTRTQGQWGLGYGNPWNEADPAGMEGSGTCTPKISIPNLKDTTPRAWSYGGEKFVERNSQIRHDDALKRDTRRRQGPTGGRYKRHFIWAVRQTSLTDMTTKAVKTPEQKRYWVMRGLLVKTATKKITRLLEIPKELQVPHSD